MRSAFASVAILGLALAASPTSSARAQPAPNEAADDMSLTEKYELAEKHFEAERYTEALPLYEEVTSAIDSPNAQVGMGRCLSAMGRKVEAHAALSKVGEVADRRHDKTGQTFDEARALAKKLLRDLEAELGRVRFIVKAERDGLVVTVGGKTLENDAIDQIVVVDPGEHPIVATLPDHQPMRKRVQVRAGEIEAVDITLEAIVVENNMVPDPNPQLPPPDQGIGDVRIGGIVVAGLGLAGIAVFAGTGIAANALFDDLSSRCGTNCTSTSDRDDVSRGRTLDTVANVSLGIGAAALVAGTFMIIFGGPSEDAAQAAGDVTLVVTPTAVFGGYALRF